MNHIEESWIFRSGVQGDQNAFETELSKGVADLERRRNELAQGLIEKAHIESYVTNYVEALNHWRRESHKLLQNGSGALQDIRAKLEDLRNSIFCSLWIQDPHLYSPKLVKFLVTWFAYTEEEKMKILEDCAEQDPRTTMKNLPLFDLNETTRKELAAKWAWQYPGLTAMFFRKFGIEDEEDCLEIAMLCGEKDGLTTWSRRNNFGLRDPKSLVALSRTCAEQQHNAQEEEEVFNIQGPEPAPVLESAPLPEAPLDSVRSLIEEFSSRRFAFIPSWHYCRDFTGWTEALGYVPANAQRDESRLEQILKEHNKKFKSKIGLVNPSRGIAGYIEKKELPNGSHIFVRADLHSDLASLLAQLKVLKEEGYLDENYICKPNFHMIFLGDYMDRGGNDLELMTLLLKLRIENPDSVHLIRGNHEDIEANKAYSSNKDFILERQGAFTQCYQSFPLALCVGSEEKYSKAKGRQQRQYIHFSHALFSPAVNLSSFLQGNDGPTLQVQGYTTFPATEVSLATKAGRAMNELKEKYAHILAIRNFQSYMWNDISKTSGPARGAYYQLTPEDIHLYLKATSSEEAKIAAIFRGHQHSFEEFAVDRKEGGAKGPDKIIATTLAIGVSSGETALTLDIQNQEPLQGMILTVQPKAGAWTKQQVVLQPQPDDNEFHVPAFAVEKETTLMYELLVH